MKTQTRHPMTPPSWAGRSRVARATASAASSPTISPMAGSHTITPWKVGGSGAEPTGSRVKKPRAARNFIG